MLTRNLLKFFLTFSLFALLLTPGTALAAAPEEVPENPNCLDVSLSTAFSDGVVSVASPPGQGITFAFALYVTNNCTTAVTGAKIEAPINLTCPGGSVNDTPTTIEYPVPVSIASGQNANEKGEATAFCAIMTDGVPTSSVVPTSVSVTVSAKGTDASGNAVYAPEIVLTIK